MTHRQLQTLKEWIPIATMLVAGAVAWTSLRRDVAESVRTPRFEAESIRVHQQLGVDRARLDALERERREYLQSICRAVRCSPPR